MMELLKKIKGVNKEFNKVYEEVDKLSQEEKIKLINEGKCTIETCHLDNDSIGLIVNFID